MFFTRSPAGFLFIEVTSVSTRHVTILWNLLEPFCDLLHADGVRRVLVKSSWTMCLASGTQKKLMFIQNLDTESGKKIIFLSCLRRYMKQKNKYRRKQWSIFSEETLIILFNKNNIKSLTTRVRSFNMYITMIHYKKNVRNNIRYYDFSKLSWWCALLHDVSPWCCPCRRISSCASVVFSFLFFVVDHSACNCRWLY